MKVKTLIRGIKRIENWHVWLAEYLHLLPNKEFVTYKFRDGMEMKVRPYTSDRGIIQEVLLYNCYDYVGMVGGGETVIDIGAQAGYFSSLALMRGAGKVIAFEPIDENFEMAEENMANASEVSMFMDNDYCLYNTAVVGSDIDELQIFIDKENSGGHSAHTEGDNFTVAPTENINNIIDSLLEVDVLKCDCEGGEYDIFFKIKDENLQKIKQIIVEAHPLGDGSMPYDLHEFLESKGFLVSTDAQDTSEMCVFYACREE